MHLVVYYLMKLLLYFCDHVSILLQENIFFVGVFHKMNVQKV